MTKETIEIERPENESVKWFRSRMQMYANNANLIPDQLFEYRIFDNYAEFDIRASKT